MAKRKKDITRDEFVGNYAVALKAEVLAVIEAYRTRAFGKDALRVYAAMLESRALHPRSKVDLHGIVNAKRSVAHSLSRTRVSALERELRKLLTDVPQGGRKVAVSRQMARFIARGQLSCSESVVLLFYCVRRKKQRRRFRRLQENERYARFRYGWLSELSGCGRSTLCRAVARLRWHGLLQTVEVPKILEKEHGCVFVDGPLVSLTCPQGRPDGRRRKTTTVPAVSDNTPWRFSTTLENKDPKREIQNRRGHRVRLHERDGVLVASIVHTRRMMDPEFERIQERVRQMRGSFADAVA